MNIAAALPRTSLAILVALGAAAAVAGGATVRGYALAGGATVRGYWRGPSGSIIRIAPCEKGLCVQIVALPTSPHPYTDIHNPDPSRRGRPLCGLRIGEGFSERYPGHADGGHIYDPRVGRTYRATMRAEEDRLELRGFVGVRLFGRTETWKRARPESVSCGCQ